MLKKIKKLIVDWFNSVSKFPDPPLPPLPKRKKKWTH